MESLKGLANARYQCWRTVVCPEKILAMKLGLALPMVGPAVSSAAGLSAFCRGLEDLGYDTLWVGDRLVTPVDMHSTYPGSDSDRVFWTPRASVIRWFAASACPSMQCA